MVKNYIQYFFYSPYIKQHKYVALKSQEAGYFPSPSSSVTSDLLRTPAPDHAPSPAPATAPAPISVNSPTSAFTPGKL